MTRPPLLPDFALITVWLDRYAQVGANVGELDDSDCHAIAAQAAALRAAPPSPMGEAEPVAWQGRAAPGRRWVNLDHAQYAVYSADSSMSDDGWEYRALYTHPPVQREASTVGQSDLTARLQAAERDNRLLIAGNERIRTEAGEYKVRATTAETQLAELRAELERVREDAERLDWLAYVSRTTTVYMDGRHPWNMTGNLKLRDLRGPTLRAAIDTARAAADGGR